MTGYFTASSPLPEKLDSSWAAMAAWREARTVALRRHQMILQYGPNALDAPRKVRPLYRVRRLKLKPRYLTLPAVAGAA